MGARVLRRGRQDADRQDGGRREDGRLLEPHAPSSLEHTDDASNGCIGTGSHAASSPRGIAVKAGSRIGVDDGAAAGAGTWHAAGGAAAAAIEAPKERDEMLKGIDHRLNAEVLACLRAMGHGDVLIVADTNFPSDSVARATVTGQLLRMENLTAAQAVEADPVGAAAGHLRR